MVWNFCMCEISAVIHRFGHKKCEKIFFWVNKVKDIATEFCHRQWENQWCGVPVLLGITHKLIYIKTLAALIWQATALDLNSKQEIAELLTKFGIVQAKINFDDFGKFYHPKRQLSKNCTGKEEN